MRRTTFLVACIGILAALGSLGWVLLGDQEPGDDLQFGQLDRRGDTRGPDLQTALRPERGGVYTGVVVDGEGTPVAGASVLLVALDTGDAGADLEPADPTAPAPFDPTKVAVIDYKAAGEGRTDAAGRFRVAADGAAAVGHVVAWSQGFMPRIVDVGGRTSDITIVVQAGGRVIGKVIDKETGRPISGADVAVYLQNKASVPGVGGDPGVPVPLEPLAVLQRFVARVLGPRVWGVRWEGDDALHVKTDRDGRFEFGPVGDTVQIEFVVTHSDYMWTDMDLKDDRVRRTVVGPGETVERTFQLERGNFIEGRVVDDQGNGLPDVAVEVEHVVQRAQHWWYRNKRRVSTTRSDGSFRVSGLSHGDYVVVLRHPSFGTEHHGSIPENATGLQFVVRPVGGLSGVVEGLDRPAPGARVEVQLEEVDPKGQVTGRHSRRFHLDLAGAFQWPDLVPRKYVLQVRSGERSSLPMDVEIESHRVTAVTVILGGGGTVELTVTDAAGRRVDPAAVTLTQVGEGGSSRPYGQYVSRAGVVRAEGIRPGTYRAEVTSPQFIPVKVEPFQVEERGVTRPPPVTLARWAFLRIAEFKDRRRVRSLPRVELRHGDGAWTRAPAASGPTSIAIRVHPGAVGVRVVTEAEGTVLWEQTYQVADGGHQDVEVVLE
jgi:hypothetical protein